MLDMFFCQEMSSNVAMKGFKKSLESVFSKFKISHVQPKKNINTEQCVDTG